MEPSGKSHVKCTTAAFGLPAPACTPIQAGAPISLPQLITVIKDFTRHFP
jgi:hypothetical protein